ncbi:hypothetical protein O181_104261 [Austropuccinia psidii MF-1]|uniref:HAT C-terminal dimerisation domain-containing protein n=1 Tax=Austropuccinia psidii MF-1 TaxID=1389203 RepID=A0A9Q3PL83_9BASI|nr:hypothetical protein [Austropuccinia psidii MF-1]
MKTLKSFKLEQHIMCITTDNASSNNSMAWKLEETLGSFNAAMQHIGCMAHIIHLAARDGLNAFSLDSSSPDNNIPPDNWINNCMSMETLVDSPDGMHLKYYTITSQISRLAFYLNQSPQQREKFITTVCLVYNGATPTHATSLLSHVSTRWNSTYNMLEQALTLKDAYKQFTSSAAMESYKVTPLEWEKVGVMVDFLMPLYEATLIISSLAYPTINHALPLYLSLIKKLKDSTKQYDVGPIEPASKAIVAKLSEYLKFLILKVPAICATILDPQFKVKFLMAHEETLVEFGTSSRALLRVFEEEALKHFEMPNEPGNPSSPQKQVQLYDDMYTSSGPEGHTLEIEIQHFFAKTPEAKDTDILAFWKSQGKNFPALRAMACKYLAIPATSALSERVFSGGRKILSYQRASLSPMHVEHLACVKDWARTFCQLYSEV